MNLLISRQGEVLGQTLSPENAHRRAMIARTPMYAVTREGELGTLPPQTLASLRGDYGNPSFATLWRMLGKQKFPYWGKVSVQCVLRSLYSNGKSYTRDELMETIPGATWISITTAMSMLKNKKYAKPGKPIVITQIDGKYQRR